jgi:hypothetical protein
MATIISKNAMAVTSKALCLVHMPRDTTTKALYNNPKRFTKISAVSFSQFFDCFGFSR